MAKEKEKCSKIKVYSQRRGAKKKGKTLQTVRKAAYVKRRGRGKRRPSSKRCCAKEIAEMANSPSGTEERTKKNIEGLKAACLKSEGKRKAVNASLTQEGVRSCASAKRKAKKIVSTTNRKNKKNCLSTKR